MIKHRIALVAAAAATVTALSACGSSSSSGATKPMSSSSTSTSGSAATGAHNSTDVTFATDMIPHHAQAVEMADMAIANASNADVMALAVKIKAAQDPEIVTMTGWLKAWKQPVPSSSMSGMGSSNGMGMMSDADMSTLSKATGKAFNSTWVTMMITHHQGAVAMAKTELASGQYTGAKTLAQSIITSQTAQIAQLKSLDKQLA